MHLTVLPHSRKKSAQFWNTMSKAEKARSIPEWVERLQEPWLWICLKPRVYVELLQKEKNQWWLRINRDTTQPKSQFFKSDWFLEFYVNSISTLSPEEKVRKKEPLGVQKIIKCHCKSNNYSGIFIFQYLFACNIMTYQLFYREKLLKKSESNEISGVIE